MSSVERLLCCAVIVVLIVKSKSCDEERLLSGARFRVQDRFFTASTADSDYLPHEARLDGDSWCSADPHQLLRPFLQITFGTAVNISTLRIGGYDSVLSDHYVIRFRVLVDGGTDNTLSAVNSSINSMEFSRRSTPDNTDTPLPSTVTTQVLKIEAVAWTPSDQVCMKLEVFGCLAQPECVEGTSLISDGPLLDTVTASDSIPTDGLHRLVDSGSSEWCTGRSNVDNTSYLQLHFTRPVTLTYMQVRGYRSLVSSSYIRRFVLEVQDDLGNFTAYEPEFVASGPSLETMTIWRPVRGTVFRLLLLDHKETLFNNVCWKIKVYGCAEEEGASTSPVTLSAATSMSAATPLISISDTLPVTFASPSAPATQGMDTSTSSPEVVLPSRQIGGGVVVGVSVVGVVVLGVIIVLAIAIVCIFLNKRKSKSLSVPITLESPERKVDNSIYGEEVLSGPLYSDNPNGSAIRTTEYFPAGAELPSSVPNTYDIISHPLSRMNEPVQYSKLNDVLDLKTMRKESSNSHNASDGIYEKLDGEVDSIDDTASDAGSMTDNPMYGQMKT